MMACFSFRSTARSTPLTISVPSSRATWRFLISSSATAVPFAASILLRSMVAGPRLLARAGRGLLGEPLLRCGACLSESASPRGSVVLLAACCSLMPFGAKRCPDRRRSSCLRSFCSSSSGQAAAGDGPLARQGMREFKDSVSGKDDDDDDARASFRPPRHDVRVADARARHRLLARRPVLRRIAPAAPGPRGGGDARRAPRRAPAPAVHLHPRDRSRASRSRYAFHERIIEKLIELLPEGTAARHARRHRAVLHLAQGRASTSAVAIALPVLLWQVWAFLAPAIDDSDAAGRSPSSWSSPTVLFAAGVAFCYFVVLPAALDFLVELRRPALRRAGSGELLLLVRHAHAAGHGLAFEMPIFILALVRLGVLSSATAAPEPAHRLRRRCSSSRSCCRPSTRSRSPSRWSRCSLLFELSIWLSAVMERRWERAYRRVLESLLSVRVLSADWVVPVEGDPIRDGAVAIGDDGRIAAVGTAAELGAGERFDGRRDPARASSTPTRTSSTPSTPASATGSPFAPWIGMHIERKALGSRTWRRSPASGAADCLRSGITTIGDAASPAQRRRRAPSSGCGRSSTSRCSAGPRRSPSASSRSAQRVEGTLLRARSGSASRPTRRTRAPPSSTRRALALGLPLGDTPLGEREHEAAYVRGRQRPVVGARAMLLVHPLGESGIRALADARPARPSACSRRTACTVDAEEIALLATHGVAVAHCPRSNALARLRRRPAAGAPDAGVRVCIATDSPASTPSFDMFEELRAAVLVGACARGDPRALSAAEALELATLGGARALGLDGRDRLVDARQVGRSRRRLTRRIAFSPVEDPAVAAVLGGSPGPGPRYSRRWRGAVQERNDVMARFDKSRAEAPKPDAAVTSPPRRGVSRWRRPSKTRCSSHGSAATRSGCSSSSRSSSGSASSASASAPEGSASATSSAGALARAPVGRGCPQEDGRAPEGRRRLAGALHRAPGAGTPSRRPRRSSA